MSRVLGRYALIKPIGRGGMAEVWSGKAFGSSGFEKVVAIKLLAKEMLDKESYHQALTDEALLQVTLKHPNIVDIYDLNVEGETPYMVMEYVEGMELRDLLKILKQKGKNLPLPIAAAVAIEISKALSYAHQRIHPETGEPLVIVHRDVSPSNILVSAHGEIKLSDFGIAKSALQTGVTQVGQIKGKFRYMSPEQARGEKIDYRSDIYSLGLVFYECLTKQPAYESASDAALLMMAQKGAIALSKEIPESLRPILNSLLALDPHQRYQELEVFRKDLIQATQLLGGIAGPQDIKDYLTHLDLDPLKKAIAAKKEAAASELLPSSKILDETGQVATLAYRQSKKKRLFVLGMSLLLVSMASGWFFFHSQKKEKIDSSVMATVPESGILEVKAAPVGTSVEVRYGKTRLTQPAPLLLENLPFNEPVQVQVSKKGYGSAVKTVSFSSNQPRVSLFLPLSETPLIRTHFTATPYAAVSIVGQFLNQETPFLRSLAPEKYEVQFFHEPSGRQVSAVLEGGQGGSFLCSADMRLNDQKGKPTAVCHKE